ncbi:MAG: hypothetical protein E7396_03035 [Ruminococcaceae bacterium]|nr:hypothetical protein [Oscillospiraceae bacterium]
MPYLIIFIIFFIIALSFYMYFLAKRFLKILKVNTENTLTKIIITIFSIITGIMSANMFSFFAVIILHFVVICLVADLINLIISYISKFLDKKDYSKWKAVHSLCIVPFVLTTIIIIFGHINLNSVQKTSYTVLTDKAISDSGYRVALLADIHYGVSLDKEGLMKICERINDENADIVVLCGDITDDDTSKKQMEEVYSVLGNLKSKYGTYYVYGNHDRQQYKNSPYYTAEHLKDTIEKNNISILCDEKIEIGDDFVIIGREDASYGSFSKNQKPRKSIKDFYSIGDDYRSSFIMVLDHQPKNLKENASFGVNLTLSGHTHGGQIWPVNIIDKIVKLNELNYGKLHLDNDSDAIVTSGVAGWKYPIKTASPSEYVIIDIKKK